MSSYGRRRWRIIGGCLASMLILVLASVGEAADEPVPMRLLIIGDSLTAGYGLDEREAFPAQLEAALRARGREVTIEASSVSGDTTAGGRARLAWALGSTPEDAPDAVMVQLGGNDALRGFDPDETFANLDAILGDLGERRIGVLFTGMRAPPNMGGDYVQRFDAVFPRLAEKHDVVFYPFFLDGVAAVPELNQGDGIHPNAEGVAEIVERITPAVLEVLDQSTD